jgi:hypothetical protein
LRQFCTELSFFQAAAEFVVSTNDQGGAAEAISRFVLGKDAGSSNEM